MSDVKQHRRPASASILFVVATLLSCLASAVGRPRALHGRVRPCYDYDGRAQRCFPPFVNAAFNVPVEATDTCGTSGPEFFCQQTGIGGMTKSCDTCDEFDPQRAHPAAYLTDFHSTDNLTWWQSSTMLADVQWPQSVNLTLRLGKVFEITYVRLKFHSSRPESFAIYRRANESSDWAPYQFYSSSCEATYELPSNSYITRDNEGQAFCRDDFSDISPLSGASVAFSTLEGRPGAYDFENNPVLQEWVVATDIRIVLNRINTFRDEVFGDPNVLRSYFYAISDLAIGGRCKCNGHAKECHRGDPRELQVLEELADYPTADGTQEERRLVCRCEHHTTGPECDKCLPFYNDRPWHQATIRDAYECQPCDCSGKSDECYFDEDLYERTGHGGHCINCQDNTGGVHCEICQDFYYRDLDTGLCQYCGCHPDGSESEQCDTRGYCRCKPGVMGNKCNQCQPNFYDLGPDGCRTCECSTAGTLDNNMECQPDTGTCPCKEYVEGHNCDRCKAGYFGLSADDLLGCTPCFCYGHSTICESSNSHEVKLIESNFQSGDDGWIAETRQGVEVPIEYSDVSELIYLPPVQEDEIVFFVAPDKFLGDRRLSYNQLLTFTMYVDDDHEDVRPSVLDVVLEGGGGLEVSAPIFAQRNAMPTSAERQYQFRLSEHTSYSWSSQLTTDQFLRLLSNLTAIKLRASYSPQAVTFLDDVTLTSAVVIDPESFHDDEDAEEDAGRQVALFVEQCTCPEGYADQFCGSCQSGYHRDLVNGGPYARCIMCSCNGHSDTCHRDTGVCYCEHSTMGDHCDRCVPGYYGFAQTGTPEDCKPCPCPFGGNCVQLLNDQVACLDCPRGHSGLKCDECSDGYYDNRDNKDDDDNESNSVANCVKCSCSNNIDSNAVANCDRFTGECLKCIYNTTGFHCDRCLPGYYGEALAEPHGHCLACNCFALGTVGDDVVTDCDVTGQCPCLDHVTGRHCDRCEEGFWDIVSGNGCQECRCDAVGSVNGSCDVTSGQCYCQPGVSGAKCDQCMPHYYAFSDNGCKACACDVAGSTDLECDPMTGQCPCKTNILGLHCDKCAENKYNIAAGCLDCSPCYNEVQSQVKSVRDQLLILRDIIEYIATHPPQETNDTSFMDQLTAVNVSVNELWQDASMHGENTATIEQFHALTLAIDDIVTSLSDITGSTDVIDRTLVMSGVENDEAVKTLEHVERQLEDARTFLDADGRAALAEAIEEQRRAGQQSDRMTEIAGEARDEVERQEEEAMLVDETSSRALNTSYEAQELARRATNQALNIADEIVSVTTVLEDVMEQYNETRRMSEESRDQAQQTYDESLRLVSEAESLRLSTFNITTIEDETEDIKQQAATAKQEANELFSEHAELMSSVDDTLNTSRLALEDAREQQNVTETLMTDVTEARRVAQEAVDNAERMLREAEKTLTTLEEFDEVVRTSREAAEEAVALIPEIERNIIQAENSTRTAREQLEDAEMDALEAEEKALAAQNISATLVQTSDEIRRYLNVTVISKNELTEISEQLVIDIDELEERLRQLEEQAEDDSRLIQQALEKADESKSVAERTTQTVSTTLERVSELLDQLAGLATLNETSLEELEKLLDRADSQLVVTDIDSRYSNLEATHTEIERWIVDYGSELASLTVDVDNIRDINETLPRGCFKKVELEPMELPSPTLLAPPAAATAR